MPAKRKISFEYEGKTIEIDAPAGWVHSDDMEERFEADLQRRTRSIKKSHREELLKDEDFRAAALEAWDIDPDKMSEKIDQAAKGKVSELEAAWENKKLSPLKKQLDEATGTINGLRKNALHRDIELAAREAGVDERFLKRIGSKGTPAIIAMVEDAFGYDAETNGWYVRQGDRFKVSTSATDESPYMGPSEYLKSLSANKDYADYFAKAEPQRGPGFGRERQANGGSTRAVANDPISIGAALEDIASGKATVTLGS